MATIGYARVSTSDQNPEAQAARLHGHGCLRVFIDHGVTGRLASRPQWDACRAFLRDGDVLVVTKLDRIGRSVGNLVGVAGDLDRRGVDLIVLDQAINTGTPAGRMLFHVLAAIAEHDLIPERTRDGLAAARGRHGGRLPPHRRGRRDLPRQVVPGAAAWWSRDLTRPWQMQVKAHGL